MSFKVEWLKDGIGRPKGLTFEMDDRTLFQAWKDDGWCKEVKQRKAEVTKPRSAKVKK